MPVTENDINAIPAKISFVIKGCTPYIKRNPNIIPHKVNNIENTTIAFSTIRWEHMHSAKKFFYSIFKIA